MSLIQERIQDVYKQSANVEGRKYQGAKITQCTVSSIIYYGVNPITGTSAKIC